MPSSEDKGVRGVIIVWCNRATSMPVPARLKQIADELYAYRNPPKDDAKSLQKWRAFVDSLPPGSIDGQVEIMAAVEHYFYARSQVANGEYSETNMKGMIYGYQLLKRAGLDPRHNKNNPTTPASELQQRWALLGATQGSSDLADDNRRRQREKRALVVPPNFRLPPNFTGALGGKSFDRVRY